MLKISEIVIVEGKHDSANLMRHFDVVTIQTNGTHLSRAFLEQLKQLAKTQRLLVFTDPDSQGNRIRETISREIPECLHAFLSSDDCRCQGKVGVEFANEATLTKALTRVISFQESSGSLKTADLVSLRLNGHRQAKANRKRICSYYQLGDCNAKTLLRRLNAIHCEYSDLERLLEND